MTWNYPYQDFENETYEQMINLIKWRSDIDKHTTPVNNSSNHVPSIEAPLFNICRELEIDYL